MCFCKYLGQYLDTAQHSLVLKLKLFTTVINGNSHREIVLAGDMAAGLHNVHVHVLKMVQ